MYFTYKGFYIIINVFSEFISFIFFVIKDFFNSLINLYQSTLEIILNMYLEFLICCMQFFIFLSSLCINISRGLQNKIFSFQNKIKL